MLVQEAFEVENLRNERKAKVLGFILTILVHVLILAILYFLHMTIPNPPFPVDKGGIEIPVDYGNSQTGMGDEEPAPNDNPSLTQGNTNQDKSNGSTEVKPITKVSNTASAKSTMTSDSKDAVLQENSSKVKTDSKVDSKTESSTAKTTTTAVQETKPVINNNALFHGAGHGNGPSGNNPNGHSASQGNNPGFGNMGDPNGTHSNVYHGTAPGGDGDFNLANRSCLGKSKPSVSCNEQGTVIVKIKVNKNGKVVEAHFTQAGSSTAAGCLVQAAEKDALSWKFNPDDDAADVQQGTIKYVFKNR
jgi:outer membrane biosynthesis protein TonB